VKSNIFLIKNLLYFYLAIIASGGTLFGSICLVSEIDVTAPGVGLVKCRDWVDIKAEIKGIIKEVVIQENQYVKEGDLLFEIEDRERRLKVAETEIRIEELEIDLQRLKGRIALVSEKNSASIVEARAALDGSMANYRSVSNGPKPEEIALLKSRILKTEAFYEKAKKDSARMKRAFSLSLIPKLDLDNSLHKKRIADVELKIARDELNLLKNKFDKYQIAAAKSDVERCSAYLTKAMASSKENELLWKKLEGFLKKLSKEKKLLAVLVAQLKLTRVRSPISGYVLTHDTRHLVGKSVSEGSTVLRIGDNRKLIIECKVSERDLPPIELGQEARVRIKSFPKGEYGPFKGEVLSIGADICDTNDSRNPGIVDKIAAFSSTGRVRNEGYFPVILGFKSPHVITVFGKIYKVRPGFSAEVEIITHREKISTFFLRRILRIKGNLQTERMHLPGK